MSVKHSNVMRLSELCRADRILGRTDGTRNLKAERSEKRRLLQKREAEGKIQKVGRSGWRVLYLVAAFIVVVASTSAFAETKNFYDARGNRLGSATTYDGVTVYYDAGGDRTGSATLSPSGTTTYRDKFGRTEATTSGPLDLGRRR